jgi:hypothetical protein
MTCTDYERHERLLECDHGRADVQVYVELTDGCSGRVCQDCMIRLGIKHWQDLGDRIAGPGGGLDALQMLRALARGATPGG